jgi:hypothetical protein
MCNYAAPRQFAYIDPTGKFQRLGTKIENKEQMESCRKMISSKAVYESVYGWTGWKGGMINAEISETAVIDGVFLDFDDKDDPQKAIRDAAEVAAYVGHCTCNFSGAKGAHIFIHCYPVDLIPDLKGHVIRQFVNNLVDVLPELDTLDFSVVGDTSRVRRIIDSVHPGTKLHAIGLTAEELATLSIDEIREMAENRRGLIRVQERNPSQWVTDELYRIEGEIIVDRFKRLYDKKIVSTLLVEGVIDDIQLDGRRHDVYNGLCTFEEEARRIRAQKQLDLRGYAMRGGMLGETREETWLLKAIIEFRATGRAATGSRKSEHKARVHLAKLADECGWTLSEICDIYTGADDYDPRITERMVQSCIGRR